MADSRTSGGDSQRALSVHSPTAAHAAKADDVLKKGDTLRATTGRVRSDKGGIHASNP
jgi:hypothetical protein